jgi:hypothetical protein
METTSPIHYSEPSQSFFRTRHNTTVVLSIALLLFMLPFTRIKCSTYPVAQNTGIGLATGKQWKVTFMGMNNDTMKELGDISKTGNTAKEYKTGINWFVLVSLVFGVGAIVFSLFNWQHRSLAVMGASLVTVLLLIAAFIHLKISLSKLPAGNKDDSLNFNMSGMIKVEFTVWYYLSLAGFAAAAFFAYKHSRIELQDRINRAVKFEFQQPEVNSAHIDGDA